MAKDSEGGVCKQFKLLGGWWLVTLIKLRGPLWIPGDVRGLDMAGSG